MKTKVAKKAVKANYNKIIGIGYCNAQHLLQYAEPFAYSAGGNGWACDYYDIENVCISTGYDYIGNVKPNYETLDKYNNQAREIAKDYNIDWEIRKEKVNSLLEEFVKEMTK